MLVAFLNFYYVYIILAQVTIDLFCKWGEWGSGGVGEWGSGGVGEWGMWGSGGVGDVGDVGEWGMWGNRVYLWLSVLLLKRYDKLNRTIIYQRE